MMDTRKIMDLNNITCEFDLSAMENQPLRDIDVISALQDDDEKIFKSIATKGADKTIKSAKKKLVKRNTKEDKKLKAAKAVSKKPIPG